MTKYAAYFDVSGRAGDAAVAVAGYIASVRQWEEFSREWAIMLADEELTTFHMTDCETFHREYRGWKPERRTAVLQRCHAIIRGRVAFAISGGLLMRSYRNLVVSRVDEIAAGSPAWLCLIQVYDHVSAWSRLHQPGGPVDIRFEDGDDCRQDVHKLHPLRLESDRGIIGDLSFVPKSHLPTQAADMHAYESWKQLVNRRASGTLRPFRRSLNNLARDIPVMDTFMDEEALTALIRQELVKR